MGRFVIVAYTPKQGAESKLLDAVRKHIGVLKAQSLVSDKAPYVMRAESGAIVEVFEWKSAEAISEAHENPAVQALWAEFAEVCEYTPLNDLNETKQMFAEFESVAV